LLNLKSYTPENEYLMKKSSLKRNLDKNHPAVVGVGASAGGIEAFIDLLSHLQENTGFAFVFVEHLSSHYKSALTQILSRKTKLTVLEAKNGMPLEADHVYVISPDTYLGISTGKIVVKPRPKNENGKFLPIDYLFNSIAKDQEGKAIGVLLSGTGFDGTEGIKNIKSEGGITFAQNERSSKYFDMPSAAIQSASIDFILSPSDIAEKLREFGKNPYLVKYKHVELPENDYSKIFVLLNHETGADFSYYKKSTISRRIIRRMILQRMDSHLEYLKFLEKNPTEVKALYKDLLISVTSFFRESEAFMFLRKKIFQIIIKKRAPKESIRIWVPACSTGEEVYSVAICIQEALDNIKQKIPVQIFGTDLSEANIKFARAGIYPENIAAQISSARLRNFFVKGEDHYKVSKVIREMCIFSNHNLIKDPPLSNMNFVSCRNVLIYMDPPLQKKIIAMLHYALKPNGYLMLGSSESANVYSNLFTLCDKRYKVYVRNTVSVRIPFDFSTSLSLLSQKPKERTSMKDTEHADFDMEREVERALLDRYSPSAVLINSHFDIIQVHGAINSYIQLPQGKVTHNIFNMVREGLMLDLKSAIDKASRKVFAVRKEGVKVRTEHGIREVNFEVVPIHDPFRKNLNFLITFEETKESLPHSKLKPVSNDKGVGKFGSDKRLKQELVTTKKYLQALIEEKEANNEELKAANEEVQSSNEELQSMNEELETAKEELQSTNEELLTLNTELQHRNVELTQINSDLSNVMESINIPILLVDRSICIRRFTPMIRRVMNIIASDVGRSVNEIKLKIKIANLDLLTLDVIEHISTKELEVQDDENRWYVMSIRPYKTLENKIDGAVITFIDITERKQAESNNLYLASIVESTEDAIIGKTVEGIITSWNRGAEKLYGYQEKEVVGRNISLLAAADKKSEISDILRKIKQGESIVRFETERMTKDGRKVNVLLSISPIRNKDGQTVGVSTVAHDITERKKNEVALEGYMEDLKQSNKELEQFAYIASHDLKEPLSVVSNYASLLLKKYKDKPLDDKGKEFIDYIMQGLAHMHTLIDGLLEYSRIGRSKKSLEEVDTNESLKQAIKNLQMSIENKNAVITVSDDLPVVEGNKIQITQLFQNLISNALKFSGDKPPKISISVRRSDYEWVFMVKDNGIGISQDHFNKIFEIFNRLHNYTQYPGIGLGLALCKRIIEQHDGKIWVNSQSGKGSTFYFTIPVKRK
jgi:two-component system CheB/CheR fusion protein